MAVENIVEDNDGQENSKALITISAIVAGVYSVGYISHIIKNYILGIDYQLSEIDILTTGGDFILSTIIDSLKFTFLNMRMKLVSLFHSTFLLSTISVILFYFIRTFETRILNFFNCTYATGKSFKKINLTYILILLASLNILYFQIGLLSINNILQPVGKNYKEEIRENNYRGIPNTDIADIDYKKYVQPQNEQAIFQKFFSNNHKTDLIRLNYYSTIFILLCVLLFIILRYYKTNNMLIATIFLNFLILPASYSCIGSSLQYKNCITTLKGSEKKLAGLMLANGPNEIILYSKVDQFSITQIPKGDIGNITFLGKQHLLSVASLKNFIVNEHITNGGQTYIELRIYGFNFNKNDYEIQVTTYPQEKTLQLGTINIQGDYVRFSVEGKEKKVRIYLLDSKNSNTSIYTKVSSPITTSKGLPIKFRNSKND